GTIPSDGGDHLSIWLGIGKCDFGLCGQGDLLAGKRSVPGTAVLLRRSPPETETCAMRNLAFLAGTAILLLSVPAATLSQGQGKGQGGGQAEESRGGGKEKARDKAENRGNQGKGSGPERRPGKAAELGRDIDRAAG